MSKADKQHNANLESIRAEVSQTDKYKQSAKAHGEAAKEYRGLANQALSSGDYNGSRQFRELAKQEGEQLHKDLTGAISSHKRAAGKAEAAAAPYKAEMERLDTELSKMPEFKQKTVRTAVLFSEINPATGKSEVHFRIDKQQMSKTEYNQQKPRGILHKIDAKFKAENIGLQSANMPKTLMKAKSFAGIKANALALENVALRVGDTAKMLSRPIGSALKVKVANTLYSAVRQETGAMAATTVGRGLVGGIAASGRTLISHHRQKTQYKTYQLKVQRQQFKAKLDDIDLALGKKVDTHIKLEFGGSKKENVLVRKEFKNAKKAYNTRTVIENGKKVKVVDKSSPKMRKVKKPEPIVIQLGAAGMKAGVRSAKNSALNKMSTSEDSGTQAVGKSLQFTSNEFARLKGKRANSSKLKFDKKVAKANVRMEAAHNKLQFEQSKPKKPTKNSSVKKAQKKSLQKRQNKGIFKKQQAKNAKKAASKAAAKKSSGLLASKAKYAALGVLGVIILLLVPMSCTCASCSGGGGGALGQVVNYTVYSQSNVKLTEIEGKYADAIDAFYKAKKEEVNAMDEAAIENNEEPSEDNDYTVAVLRHSFTGISENAARYDIFTLFSYLSAKYRGDWSDVYAEFAAMVTNFLVLEEYGEPYTFTATNTVTEKDEDGEPVTDEDGEVVKHTCTYNYEVHFYRVALKSGLDADTYLDFYARDQLEGLYVEEGEDTGIAHYELLLQGEGGHQTLNTPLPDYDGWNRDCSLYAASAHQSKKPLENCIGVNCEQEARVTAGGDGIVISKSGTSIQISYDDFIITYYTGNLVSPLGVGSSVKDGDLIFDIDGSIGNYPLQISAYEELTHQYINPLLIMCGKEEMSGIIAKP